MKFVHNQDVILRSCKIRSRNH